MRTLSRSAIVAATTLVLLTGCSRPTDTVIPSDISTWDTQLAPSVKKLDDDQRRLVTAYLLRVKAGEIFGGKGIPPGTTLGQAIEDQKNWQTDQALKEAQEKALKEKLQKEREATIGKINQAVTVTLLQKTERYKNFDAGRYSDEQVFRIGVKNTSDRALAGVEGRLVFVDIFGNDVGSVGFKISETIQPGKDYVWVGARDYNQFISEQKAVWNLEEGKYKTQFKPEMVVFADGTKLSALEE